jgi:hypothetical protein
MGIKIDELEAGTSADLLPTDLVYVSRDTESPQDVAVEVQDFGYILASQGYAAVYRNSTWNSFVNNNWVEFPWGTVSWESHSYWSGGDNAFIIPNGLDGDYLSIARMRMTWGRAHFIILRTLVNGSEKGRMRRTIYRANHLVATVTHSHILTDLSAGDELTTQVYTGGSDLSTKHVVQAGGDDNRWSILKLGKY